MPVVGDACERLLQVIVAEVMEAELYVNDYEPTASDAVDGSDYTLASFSGDGPQSLNAFSTYTTTTGKSESTHPTLTWTPGSGASGTAYGVVIRDTTTGDLVCGIRFAVPKAISVGVDIEVSIKAFLQRAGYGS